MFSWDGVVLCGIGGVATKQLSYQIQAALAACNLFLLLAHLWERALNEQKRTEPQKSEVRETKKNPNLLRSCKLHKNENILSHEPAKPYSYTAM